MKLTQRFLALFLALTLLFSLSSCALLDILFTPEDESPEVPTAVDLDSIPEFTGQSAFVEINENVPFFTEEEIVTESYEFYSELDALGRCGVTMACIGRDIMPTEPRGDISQVKPTGWVQAEYDSDLVDGGFLYNRCHLIGFQLTGENANKKNLITGTKYMNNEGMLPFENYVADFLREEEDMHVMYRVTPVFKGQELVARGVLIEAYSVEDEGESMSLCVYIYNNQPGITIDYATGNSCLSGEALPEVPTPPVIAPEDITYYVHKTSGKFHRPTCKYADSDNVEATDKTREELIADNKSPCKVCKP